VSRQPRNGWFRLLELLSAHTLIKVGEFAFDTVLYATVVYLCASAWGPLWGSLYAFLIMTPLSIAVCYIYLRIYDWLSYDWLGIEALKRAKASGSQSFPGWKGTLIRKSDWFAFLALSLHADPFFTVAYLRPCTDAYAGIRKSEWLIFIGSGIISNAYWTLRWTVLIEVGVWAWKQMHHVFGAA